MHKHRILLVFGILLMNCKTDPEIMPITHYKYVIHLTKDFRILNLEYYTSDSLTYKKIFSYQANKVDISQNFQNKNYLWKSTYFLNKNSLADSSTDSVFSFSKLSQLYKFKYSYDKNNYRILSEEALSSVKNDTIQYTSHYKIVSDIVNGNNTVNHVDVSCSYYHDFTILENKLDIDLFLGDFNGKKNNNLLEGYHSTCPPSSGTMAPSSKYDYILDLNGMVSQRIETHATYGHHEFKGHHSKRITQFEYHFQ